MGRPLKIKKASDIDVGFNNPPSSAGIGSELEYYGVVGGNTALSTANHPTIKVRVKISTNAEADGYIIRQKGSKKYLVTDGTNTGVCTLENEADSSLNDDGMTITVTLNDSTEVRLARLSNKYGLDFSDNRYLLNFFDLADDTVIKSGTNGTTIDLIQVDNPNFYG